MDKKLVLAVDDEPRYLRLMRVNLEAAGYRFVGALTAEEGLNLLAAEPVDVVLLDVRLPTKSGFTLMEEMREFTDVPIIFVSAMGEEADKVRGLRLGADDYLTKPFSAQELLARVEAVLRRYYRAGKESIVSIGDLRLDMAQRRVFRAEQELRLSRTEFRLLACLTQYLGKVVPQDQLAREVWGPFHEESFDGLRVYVYRLRQKIETDPVQPELLITFPGVGYMLKQPSTPSNV